MRIKGQKSLAKERVGVVSFNKYGSKMIVTEYNSYFNILVKFIDTNEIVRSTWQRFTNSEIRSDYDKVKYGIGYIGKGKYTPCINGKATPQYVTWSDMLRRCCDKNFQERRHTYKGCTVAEEWHNFQNFSKWYDDNYYEIHMEEMELDKDILIKGNKIYSPSTCIFVPKIINSLFLKSDSIRGDFPIGVYREKRTNKFVAQCKTSINGIKKTVNLGTHLSPTRAFIAYKTYKENLIKEIANKYKEKIPIKLFDALLKYKVEISD